MRAEDWDAVLDLVMSQGQGAFEKGELATVVRWITTIPRSVRAGRPEVDLLLGTVQLSEGQAVAAQDVLNRVAGAPRSPVGVRAAARAMLAVAVQWEYRSDLVDQATRALGELAADPDEVPVLMNFIDRSAFETMATGSAGRAHFLAGRFAEGRRWLARP